jgi:hypothetical protein
MNAKLNCLFPEGLRHAEAERGKPCHKPTLHFVPTKAPKAEDGVEIKEKLITVELTDDTTMKVSPYTFSDVESFLRSKKASPIHLGTTRYKFQVEQDGTHHGRR